MLSTAVTIEVIVVYLQCSLPLLTCWQVQFLKLFAFLFFFYKVSSIYRQNWSCKEITSSQNSDKAASFSSVVVKLLRVCKHSATVDHFKIIHAVY